MTVYVDVLLAINMFVNFLLLASVRRVLRYDAKTGRLVLSALAGSLYSLIIFVPDLNSVFKLVLNLAVMMLMVFIAFMPKRIKSFVKLTATFTGVNFLFAGLMLALWLFAAPKGMLYNNSVVYFDVDIKLFILLSAVCYGALRLISAFAKRTVSKEQTVAVSLSHRDKTVCINALVDSGNSLHDSFSGEPVMIADRDVMTALTSKSLYTETGAFPTGERIRLIPVNTVSSSSLLAAVRIERALVDGKYEYENILLAESRTKISCEEYQLIIGSDFMK